VASLPGGTLLTVSGFGFGEDTMVTVGGEECSVVDVRFDELACRTPAVRERDATIGRHNKRVNAVWLHFCPCWAGLLLFWYLGQEPGVRQGQITGTRCLTCLVIVF
jgi:hypothetical protein